MATNTFTATIESITPVSSGVWRIAIANGSAFLHANWESPINYDSASNRPVILDPFLNVANIDYNEYNALLNNATTPSNVGYLQEVDYDRGQIVASNIEQIRNNEAVRAEVNEYIHNSAGLVRGRYGGKQLRGLKLNEFTTGSTEEPPTWLGDVSYGKNPVQEDKQIYFAYFDWAGGTTPEFTGKTALHIRYLIDQYGNSYTPDTDNISYSDLVQNFVEQTNVVVRLDNPQIAGSSNMAILNGPQKILKTGVRPEPIIYTQSGSSYTSSIQFGDDSITDYTFLAHITGSQNIGSHTEHTIVFTSESYDANNSYDKNTGVYTFADQPTQVFRFEAHVRGTTNTCGNIPYTSENVTLEILSGSTVVAQNSWSVMTPGGVVGYTWPFNKTLNFPNFFKPFQANDAISVRLVTDRITVTLDEASLKLVQVPGTAIISSPTLYNENYWHSGSEYFPLYGYTLGDNYLVASGHLARGYGLQQEDVVNSGFYDIKYPFEIKVGDEIRFEGSEYKSYMITEVSTPSELFRTAASPLHRGYLILKLDKPVAKNTNINYFLIRRFVKDGGFIIIDSNKPGGQTSGGTVVPQYITDDLNKNLKQALKIVRANDKGIQGQV